MLNCTFRDKLMLLAQSISVSSLLESRYYEDDNIFESKRLFAFLCGPVTNWQPRLRTLHASECKCQKAFELKKVMGQNKYSSCQGLTKASDETFFVLADPVATSLILKNI